MKIKNKKTFLKEINSLLEKGADFRCWARIISPNTKYSYHVWWYWLDGDGYISCWERISFPMTGEEEFRKIGFGITEPQKLIEKLNFDKYILEEYIIEEYDED